MIFSQAYIFSSTHSLHASASILRNLDLHSPKISLSCNLIESGTNYLATPTQEKSYSQVPGREDLESTDNYIGKNTVQNDEHATARSVFILMDVFLVSYSSVAAIRAVIGSVHVFAPSSSSSSTAATIGAVITRIGTSVVPSSFVATAIQDRGNDVEGACHQYSRIVIGVPEKRCGSWPLRPSGYYRRRMGPPRPKFKGYGHQDHTAGGRAVGCQTIPLPRRCDTN